MLPDSNLFFPSKNTINTTYYSQILPVNQFQSLSNLIQVDNIFNNIDILESTNNYNIEEKRVAIETAATKPDLQGSRILLNKYALFIRKIHWPSRAIKQYSDFIHPDKLGRGGPRKFKDDKETKAFPGELPDDSSESEVWIHHLQDVMIEKGYSLSNIFTKQLLGFQVLGEHGWRKATYEERGVFTSIFRNIYNELLAPFIAKGIYGTYIRGSLLITGPTAFSHWSKY